MNLLEYIQYIEENRINFLRDKYKDLETTHDTMGKLKGPDVVDHFAQRADPTKNKTHTDWIMRQYKAGKIRQEDHPRINTTLTNFEKYKPKLANKDLNSYKSLKEVDAATKPHLGTAVTNKEKDEETVNRGLVKLHDTGDKQIYHLKTKEASQKVYGGGASRGGTGTDWCTAARSSDCAFDDYDNGKLHTIHIKGDPNSPYQHHPYQFMDRHDEEADPKEFIEKHKDLQPHLGKIHPDFAMTSKELDRHIDSENNNIRAAAARNPNATHEHITKALNDEDPDVRRAAIGHPKVTPEHITKALDDEDSDVRSGASGHPKATPEHITKALNDEDPDVRRSAIGHPKATPEHITKALNDESAYVRRAAIRHPKATPEHITKALDDKNPDVRLVAIEHSKATPEHITKALDDKDSYVRRSAKGRAKKLGMKINENRRATGKTLKEFLSR